MRHSFFLLFYLTVILSSCQSIVNSPQKCDLLTINNLRKIKVGSDAQINFCQLALKSMCNIQQTNDLN